MTTIAADARTGLMVGDSKCTLGDTWTPMTKVTRHKGELIGIAGEVRLAMRWLKWYTGGAKGIGLKGDGFEAMILRKDGGLYHVVADGTACEFHVERGFHAIGTGGSAALAVMLAGHDAHEAVRIACLVDANSGGDIHALSLLEK